MRTDASSTLLFLLVVLRVLPSTEAWMRTTLADRLMGIRATSTMLPAASQPQQQQQQFTSTTTTTTSTTKKNQRDMIEFMEQPVATSSAEAYHNRETRVPPEQDAAADLVRCIVRAADGRKADDIAALRVSHVSTLTTFLVVLSGNSRPQNAAIAKAIRDAVAEQFDGTTPGGTGVPEGSPESGWMVLDYGSVMVHIMTPKSRLYYNVEGQWKDKGGEYMDLSSVLIPNSVVSSDNVSNTEADDVAAAAQQAEDDPFWS